MKESQVRVVLLAVCAGMLFSAVALPRVDAQETTALPYLNPALPPDVRAKDLVSRMTLEQKASQLVNQARAIPSLQVPAYDWWSEALHGVAVDGTTEFPEPIGLAATFDAPGIHAMAVDIGTEGRVVNAQAVRAGGSTIFHGLDFWAPNVNIFRDPRWGRGQETYGEDPFLTGRMAVAYVTGMQGDDPNHYRVISTPKHFDVHSGPEPTRHFADVDVSRHDQVDTYEPAFRAAIVDGKAGSVMCAYNAINGQPACANEYLLQDLLRGSWGFQGYVVSDCDAVHDIFSGHHYRPTQAQSSAISLTRGMDNECADFFTKVNDDHDYKPFIEAVQQGYLSEGAIDTALVRLFTARIKLGMFDPPEMDPYAKIDEKELNSPEHRALAHKLADEAMVLLKNDGTLPLKPTIRSIAVVGPLADQTRVLLGNYNGTPTHTVSMLEGLKAEFPNARITYVPGTQFLRDDGGPVPNNLLTTPDGQPGLQADYRSLAGMEMSPDAKLPKPLLSRDEPNADLTQASLPAAVATKKMLGVEWTGFLTPPDTGDYLIGIRADGFGRVTVDGKELAQEFGTHGVEAKVGRVHLEKGEKVALSVQYGNMGGGEPAAQLIWAPVNNAPSPEAVAAAKQADLTIAVVGITSQLEGEEMPVNQPGFLGGDRTSIDLPQPEEALVETVAATGKPLVVVLMNGSALAVNWINQHANAVLDAWYPGEEGGTAIADTLSGRNDPAGRLPVTFYKDVSQLPNFEDYSMQNRTYRYFTGKPLYPFGYGLSYTAFSYSDLSVPEAPMHAGDPVNATVTVTNTGKVAGDEVVQLYLKFPPVAGAPRIALRGFERIHLDPGQSRQVQFELKNRDLNMVTETGQPIIAEGDYTITLGGGQPETGAPGVTGHFRIDGQIALPE
ncbi:MAG TPA: glycoside hydrolase family 3 C-terminal domain-containing protein [Acidobacteriaceae bacterium]|jgi:beta-glucosidase|nr:glycoside hydrolase family 3 C-terminal domain-containing protein [Acidobacteriaceae bacterium]